MLVKRDGKGPYIDVIDIIELAAFASSVVKRLLLVGAAIGIIFAGLIGGP